MARLKNLLTAPMTLDAEVGAWYRVIQRTVLGSAAWFLERLTEIQLRVIHLSSFKSKRSPAISFINNSGSTNPSSTAATLTTIDQLERFIEHCLIHVAMLPECSKRWLVLLEGLARYIMTVVAWDTGSLEQVQDRLLERIRMAIKAYRYLKAESLEMDVAIFNIVLISQPDLGVLGFLIGGDAEWPVQERVEMLEAMTAQLSQHCQMTAQPNNETDVSEEEEDSEENNAIYTIDPLSRTRVLLCLASILMGHERVEEALRLHLLLLAHLDRQRMKGSGADRTYWTVFEAIRAADIAISKHLPTRLIQSYLRRLFGEIKRICGAVNVVVLEPEGRLLEDDKPAGDLEELISEWMSRLGKLDRRKNQQHLHLHWLAVKQATVSAWSRLFPWLAAPPRLHTKPATVQHHLFINVWQNDQDL